MEQIFEVLRAIVSKLASNFSHDEVNAVHEAINQAETGYHELVNAAAGNAPQDVPQEENWAPPVVESPGLAGTATVKETPATSPSTADEAEFAAFKQWQAANRNTGA